MAAAKITITLQHNQLEKIHALIATGEAGSVSGFVQHAVGAALHDAAEWRKLLKDALQQTGGPLTAKERSWADSLLTGQDGKRIREKESFSKRHPL